MTIPVEQLQKDLAQILEKVLAGEDIVITRDGRPIARVVAERPMSGMVQERTPGSARGLIELIAPDFDAPLEEMREYMG